MEFKNRCNENFEKLLQNETCNGLILSKLDEVIGHLLKYCFDPEELNKKFCISYILPEQKSRIFTADIVKKCIIYMVSEKQQFYSFYFHSFVF